MRSFIIAFICLFLTGNISAKIGDPAPIEYAGVRYQSHANEVTAVVMKTGKELWKTKVYDTIQPPSLDPKLEADVQWNIIVSLKIKGGILLVTDKQGNMYKLDLKTGKKK